MMDLLLPKLVLVLAFSGLLGFTHYKAFTGGKAAVQVKWDKERNDSVVSALKDSEAARIKDQILTAANAKVTNDYLVQKKLRAADAVANADKLRDLQATLGSSATTDTAALGGADDPRNSIIDQCASALNSLDGYAKSLALTAIGLQSYTREMRLEK